MLFMERCSFAAFLKPLKKRAREIVNFYLAIRKSCMHKIAISSFKGGTAKTSTSLHLGAALAKFHKKKVLLIDFDAQANLTTGLGFDPDAQDSMAPVLQGQKKIQEVILTTCVPKSRSDSRRYLARTGRSHRSSCSRPLFP